MIKKIAVGLVAAAAASTLAASLPAAASAATAASPTYDYQDWWGPYFSKYHLAKAEGKIKVNWHEYGEENSVHVYGKLWDLDKRTYGEGGKCAYVKFQVTYLGEDEYDWDQVYAKKHCNYGTYKKFHFEEDDVAKVRVKVCQFDPYKHYVTKCGKWDYLYSYEPHHEEH
ncbi:hypothetical protein [Thermoactinospora rubra]|uniref:hypothetical protein n=1 Tax=Thermoactinospora rubra TaxID=1088767 RepID=UPI000A0FF323|nr:hypothetical protein [Thermoactinospora rubra]